jgi:hypothetical protein
VPDQQDRLPLVVGEPGHDRVVVGEPPIAVNLDEIGEQALDDVFEPWSIRVTRDENALPRRQRSIQIPPRRLETALQRVDLTLARISVRLQRQRVELAQQHGDRLLEVQCFERRHRNSTEPAPVTCSTSATSAGEGRTRICELTSTRTRR